MPRVSIAVPVYNCERYVAQSLSSLLAQTFSDFELVISDNASTDRTEEICRGFAARDKRVRYVRRPDNIGGPGNFRYVFSLCTGEYHKWATADDYWDPTFLEKAVAVLDRRPDVVLCYPMTRLVDAEGKALEDYADNLDLSADSARVRFIQLLERIGLCNAHLGVIRRAPMLRTKLIANHGNSDSHFLAELTLHGKFALIPEYLFFRRFHPASSSWDHDDDRQAAYYQPGRKSYFGMHTWNKYRYLLGCVWRSPAPVADRVRLTTYLGRHAVWHRQKLWRDLRGWITRAHLSA